MRSSDALSTAGPLLPLELVRSWFTGLHTRLSRAPRLETNARILGPRAWPSALVALASLAAYAFCASAAGTTPLRFDVLPCIGAAGAVCALLVHAVERLVHAGGERRAMPKWTAAIFVALAVGVAQSPASIAAWSSSMGLARPLAWLARDSVLRSLAPFPLAPWCGYAIVGCAMPARWPRGHTARIAIGSVAVLAIAVSLENGLPWTRQLLHHHTPWLRPTVRIAFHTAVAALLAVGMPRRLDALLCSLGRASLPIYWLHLELAYGIASRPLAHALDPARCTLAVAATIALATLGAACLDRARVRGSEPAHTLSADVGSASKLYA